jgi:AbrB family looped-hinge helix DNA binding protein
MRYLRIIDNIRQAGLAKFRGRLHIWLTAAPDVIKYKYMKIQRKQYRTAEAVKIGVSRQVVIPKRIHDQLGLVPGDYLQVELEGDRVILTPKALIEKRIAEGLEDIRNGRVSGPFKSMSAMVRSLGRSASKTKN